MKNNYNSAVLLKTMIRQEEEKIRRWQDEMKMLPEGSLYCLCRSGNAFFYASHKGKRTGISKNRELVYALARKKRLKLLISIHQDFLDSLDASALRNVAREPKKKNGLEMDGETPLKRQLEYFAAVGLDVARITCSVKQYEWMMGEYEQNPVSPEYRTYTTYSGVAVRSKSEQSIGNALETSGIPYRYEPKIALDVSWMEGTNAIIKEYYPDFVILAADGSKIIWEHLGRVDKLDYRAHNMEKISAYRQGLGIEERQLVLTFERDLRSQELIEEIIRDRLMPYM